MEREAFASFEEFWPFYVREHGRAGTRALHVIGTTLGVLCLPAAIAMSNPWVLLAGPLLGYGFAWIGHLFVERNVPATFRHPLWSFRGDLRMMRLTALGRMGREVERHAGRR